MSVKEQLSEFGLRIKQNVDPEYRLSFNIEDDEDNVAWVWGYGLNDVEFECNHPYQCIDFGDGEEQCECLLCGSFGDYHYEEDDGGHKVPEVHEWYPRRDAGGLIGEYLKKIEDRG